MSTKRWAVERSTNGWQWRRILTGGVYGLPVDGFKTRAAAEKAARHATTAKAKGE